MHRREKFKTPQSRNNVIKVVTLVGVGEDAVNFVRWAWVWSVSGPRAHHFKCITTPFACFSSILEAEINSSRVLTS